MNRVNTMPATAALLVAVWDDLEALGYAIRAKVCVLTGVYLFSCTERGDVCKWTLSIVRFSARGALGSRAFVLSYLIARMNAHSRRAVANNTATEKIILATDGPIYPFFGNFGIPCNAHVA